MLALYESTRPGIHRSVEEIMSTDQLFAVGAAHARRHNTAIKISLCDNLGIPLQPVTVCHPALQEVH